MLAITTISFDIAVLELFLPLTCGGTVIIAQPHETVDGDALLALMRRRHVTMMKATPTTWQLLFQSGGRDSRLCRRFFAAAPTPINRQPFVIFEEAEVEAPNLQFVYLKMMDCDLSTEEKAAVDKALYLYLEGKTSEIDLPTVRDFLMAKYWEKTYASNPSSGYYCDSKIGQALFFDNYRAHADDTLPLASEDRVTIDFRCFSKVSYPPGMSSGLDFIVDPKERAYQIKRKRAGVAFLLMTLGYESIDEFLRMVFGTPYGHINPFELMTDLQFGIYNKTKYHLLDWNLDAHYERVERLYERIEAEDRYDLPARAVEALKVLSN